MLNHTWLSKTYCTNLHYLLQADINPTIQQVHISNPQVGPENCGPYTLEYPSEWVIRNYPEKVC